MLCYLSTSRPDLYPSGFSAKFGPAPVAPSSNMLAHASSVNVAPLTAFRCAQLVPRVRACLPLHKMVRKSQLRYSQLDHLEIGAANGNGNGNARRITEDDKHKLIDSIDCFVFDCDGVIWKGDCLIDGVAETVDMLRSLGKKVVFVTNNATKSRDGYTKKFTRLGLNVKREDIFSSSYAAAAFLESINFPKDKKVYVIGDVGIGEELDLLGFQHFGGAEDAGKTVSLKRGYSMPHDKDVGAVVVGFDRHINYYKIQYATLCITENPGCLFIATNTDAKTILTDAQEWAGNGAIVAAIQGATDKEPRVVGKPSDFMLLSIPGSVTIPRERMCIIGDRLETDILFGQRAGLVTMLVLSGVTTEEALLSRENEIIPDFYADKLPDLLTVRQPVTV